MSAEIRYVWTATGATRAELDVDADLEKDPRPVEAIRRVDGVESAHREGRYRIVVFLGRAFDADGVKGNVLSAVADVFRSPARMVDVGVKLADNRPKWSVLPLHRSIWPDATLPTSPWFLP